MRVTDKSLLEQMRITDFDIDHRKKLLSFSPHDAAALLALKPFIDDQIDVIVDEFYEIQTSVPDIALLIGDADTLRRLRSAQRKYILDLFCGFYGLEYVNNRLRIGLVHKRIGVEPKLYLSAVHTLWDLLVRTISDGLTEGKDRQAALLALNKVLFFDITVVFETYIRSMVAEIESARNKSEVYAESLEVMVQERTQQLEEMARTDPLTGLLNRRFLMEDVMHAIHVAQRRGEALSLVYFDVNDFKEINDRNGHQYGDEVLRKIGGILLTIRRSEDTCYRYGGDEFCVLLSNCREQDARQQFCQRLDEEVAKHLESVTLSTGIAQTGPDNYEEAGKLLELADVRMYEAKRAYKDSRQAGAV